MVFNPNRSLFYISVIVQVETYFPGVKKRIQSSESSFWPRRILQNTKEMPYKKFYHCFMLLE